MEKFIILLLPTLLGMSACSGPEGDRVKVDSLIVVDTNRSVALKDSVQTANLPAKDTTTLENFPSEWVRLSDDQNGGYLIFEPCMAANQSLNIDHKEEGDFISINLGQMAEQYKILSFQSTAALEYEIECEGLYNEGKRTISINYLNKEKGIAQWTWQNENHDVVYEPRTFVVKDQEGIYPVKKEECGEM